MYVQYFETVTVELLFLDSKPVVYSVIYFLSKKEAALDLPSSLFKSQNILTVGSITLHPGKAKASIFITVSVE